MMRLYNVEDTPLKPIMEKLGYKDMERCMFLGFTDASWATPGTWPQRSRKSP